MKEDDDEEEGGGEEEEEETSWLSDILITSDGEPSQTLIVLCKLLSMDQLHWKKFMKYPDEKKYNQLGKTQDARTLLLSLAQQKLKLLDKKPLHKNATQQSPEHKAAWTLLMQERQILQRCIDNYT